MHNAWIIMHPRTSNSSSWWVMAPSCWHLNLPLVLWYANHREMRLIRRVLGSSAWKQLSTGPKTSRGRNGTSKATRKKVDLKHQKINQDTCDLQYSGLRVESMAQSPNLVVYTVGFRCHLLWKHGRSCQKSNPQKTASRPRNIQIQLVEIYSHLWWNRDTPCI